MKNSLKVLLCLILLNISCSDDNNNNNVNSNCDKLSQVISEENFQDVITANYMITNAALDGDCLSVTISSSGCNGETWEMKLLGTNNVMESLPLQRDVKIELDNQELCLAVFQKTVSFDLIPFRVEGQNQVDLHLDGWDETIEYQY
jgi:hypothetical protein